MLGQTFLDGSQLCDFGQEGQFNSLGLSFSHLRLVWLGGLHDHKCQELIILPHPGGVVSKLVEKAQSEEINNEQSLIICCRRQTGWSRR